jgi:hypothetical protein
MRLIPRFVTVLHTASRFSVIHKLRLRKLQIA